MSGWNKHSGSGGGLGGGPPGTNSGGGAGKNMNINNPILRRGQRPPTGEDGEIGEEEGEIIGGGGVNRNNNTGTISPNPSRQEPGGPPFRGGGGPRRGSWNRGGIGGGRGPPIFGPRGNNNVRPMVGRSYSGQLQPVVPPKPDPLSRAQTFSGLASSSRPVSSQNPPHPSQQQPPSSSLPQHPNIPPGVGISRGVSAGSVPNTVARPTDPRFRGNDATARMPTIHESTRGGMSYNPPPPPKPSNFPAHKEISGVLSTPRDAVRRETSVGNRSTYNSLADIHDASNESKTSSSNNIPISRREPTMFPRASTDNDYADGGFSSPRRSTSRTINSESFARGEEDTSIPRIQATRSESNTFRGLADLPDPNFAGRPTPSMRETSFRSEPTQPNDGGSYTVRRESFRAPSSSEIGPKEYNDSSHSTGGASSSYGPSSLSRGPPPPPPSSQRDFRLPAGRRGDFRAGYGNSEEPSFRGGVSSSEGPSLRASTSNDATDSYYSGTSGGGLGGSDFRRSPPQRRSTFVAGRDAGGPLAPSIGRSSSFTHRRTDPRFPSNSYDQDNATSFGGGEGAAAPSSNDEPKSFAKLTDGDSFGRTREWSTGSIRRSPQSSPMNRRVPLSYTVSSSPSERPKLSAPTLMLGGGITQPPVNVPLVNDYSSMSYTTPPTAPSVTLPPKESEPITEQPIAPAPPPPDETPPPPLLTSALGESNIKRGEKVIGEIVELLECYDLKPTDPDDLSKLPSKQRILKAVAMMDGKLKEAQKAVEEKKLEVELAIKTEEEIRVKAKEEAISEAKRQEEERARREEEIRLDEEKTLEAEIDELTKQKMELLEIEKKKSMTELEEKLRVSREQEELKLKENLNQQIVVTADNFDKDIVKIKKDLEKSKQMATKTESKLAVIEADYKARIEKVAASGGMDKEPRTDDMIAAILAENRRRASEAHMFNFATISDESDESENTEIYDDLEATKDPKEERTTAEWEQLTHLVTGRSDALYKDPSEAPYFKLNEERHALLEPIVTEFVRDKESRQMKDWMNLAEEYEFRRIAFEKTAPIRVRERKTANIIERYSILGAKPSQVVLESSGGRTSANPYRRARRGNEVRSEYEQEQVIAELAEKEALQKRISCGGCEVPRQRTRVETALTCSYVNTFIAQRVDMLEQEEELELINVWTDMEKCIFLDRFMQHPKDFHKIASFLRNKTTSDCIRFYYDSKQSVPYKLALREHIMRRKRRGDYHVWDATVEAALSVGAQIEAGVNEEKPLVFLLPQDDRTYHTHNLHPIKREIFDKMEIDSLSLPPVDEVLSDDDEPKKNGKQRKRVREPLFVLEAAQKKFLKIQESSTPIPVKKTPVRIIVAEPEPMAVVVKESLLKEAIPYVVSTSASNDMESKDEGGLTPARKAPQKWTAEEKKIFIETLGKHGRDWPMLSKAVGTKSISQIKNYYYDYKKQVGKGRMEKRGSSSGVETKLVSVKSREEDSSSPRLLESLTSSPPETPIQRTVVLSELASKKGYSLVTDMNIAVQDGRPAAPETRPAVNDARSLQDSRSVAQDPRVAGQDTRATIQEARATIQPRAIDQRMVERWTAEQRSSDHRAMEERATSSNIPDRGTADPRSQEQREMEERMMDQRAMERRSMEQRALVEQRMMEHHRLMEQRGESKAKGTTQLPHENSFAWSLSTQNPTQSEISERNGPASSTSNSDHTSTGSEAWNHSLMQSQKIKEDAATRRLLQQHHSHSQHHQQFLSSLLPWVPSGPQLPAGAPSGGGIQEFMRLQQHQQPHAHRPSHPAHHSQQLHTQQQQQQLHTQQQQQQQLPQHTSHHHHQPQHFQQLHAPPQHHRPQAPLSQQHHQQQQQQQHERQLHQRQLSQQNPVANVNNASLNTLLAALSQQPRASDDPHLALAQHLLALQGDSGAGGDAFGLLGRSLPNNGNNPNNYQGPGNQGSR